MYGTAPACRILKQDGEKLVAAMVKTKILRQFLGEPVAGIMTIRQKSFHTRWRSRRLVVETRAYPTSISTPPLAYRRSLFLVIAP